MNTKQKQLLLAYIFINCGITIFYPSMILLVTISCITLFLYFKYKD